MLYGFKEYTLQYVLVQAGKQQVVQVWKY